MDAWNKPYWGNFRFILGSFHFTLKLDMSSIFLSLAIPTFIAFICLALKWYGELNIAKQKFKVV